MKAKAYVRGVPVTIYSYERTPFGLLYCKVKYGMYGVLLPVLAELIEMRCEND